MSKVQEDAEIRTSGLCCASAGAVCFAEHLTQLSPNGTAVPSSLVITQLSLGLNTELTQAIRRLLGLAGSPEDRKCDKHSQEPAVTHLVSSEVAYYVSAIAVCFIQGESRTSLAGALKLRYSLIIFAIIIDLIVLFHLGALSVVLGKHPTSAALHL